MPESGISSFIENLPSLSANLKPIAFGISKVNINTIVEITSIAITNEITAPYSWKVKKAYPFFL
jgi:translation elongation factor EF-1beta